jgi:cytochrome P450
LSFGAGPHHIEANGPEFDGMQDYGAHLVVDALLDAMVNIDKRRKAIFVAFHNVIPGTTYVKPGESWSLELRHAFERTMEEVRAIIEERRVSPRSDFISDLVNARDQGDKLSDSEPFDQIFGICGASLSATSRAAGGALYLLYTHLEQLAQLIRNPALIPDALEECLRLGSNGYFTFPRIATRDTEVGGTHILKGIVVRPSPLAPNYDPDVFPDPTRFGSTYSGSGAYPFARNVSDQTSTLRDGVANPRTTPVPSNSAYFMYLVWSGTRKPPGDARKPSSVKPDGAS